MTSTCTDVDKYLLELPEAEKRRMISILARSLLSSGNIVWPDNTTILDENGRELGVVIIVESPTFFPSPAPEVEDDIERQSSPPSDTIPIEEFYTNVKTRERAVQGESK